MRRVRRLPLDIVDPDVGLWLDSVRLPWSHRDPVDRLVVALAQRLAATIVTTDRRMGGFYADTVS